jgi:hypothetical protein
MLVECRHTGVQAGQRDRDLHGRARGISRIELERALALADLRRRIRETEMAPAEHALRVVGLDRVGSRAERRGDECEASGESKAADHWATPEVARGEMGGALCKAATGGVLKSS